MVGRCRENRLLGGDCSRVLEELAELASRDPRPCRVAGTMVAEAFDVAYEAYCMFTHVNYNDPESFSSVKVIEKGLERILADLLGVNSLAVVYTYGGSESTLTALYAFREAYGVDTVVVSKAAHASVFKACRILGLRCISVNVDYDLTIDVYGLERIVEKARGRVAIVATLGLTDNGAIDPLEEIDRVAKTYDIPVYVDAVYGGFIAIGLGMHHLLKLSSIRAFSLDPHKLYAPPGSGLLILLDKELEEQISFSAPYMPASVQKTLLWTRSAAGLAAAYAGLKLMGPTGLRRLAEHLMKLAKLLKIVLEEAGIPVLSKPWTPLVAFNVGRAVERIAENLRRRGIYLYPSRIPWTLRYIAKWCHDEGFVEELANIVVNTSKHVTSGTEVG